MQQTKKVILERDKWVLINAPGGAPERVQIMSGGEGLQIAISNAAVNPSTPEGHKYLESIGNNPAYFTLPISVAETGYFYVKSSKPDTVLGLLLGVTGTEPFAFNPNNSLHIGAGSSGGGGGTPQPPYTLPPATNATLGGVIVGDGLDVTSNGTISIKKPLEIPAATTTNLGGVIVGEGLEVTANGTLSVKPFTVEDATESKKGITEIATQAEVNAGTDDFRYVTPKKLKALLDNGWVTLATDQNNITGKKTFRNDVAFGISSSYINSFKVYANTAEISGKNSIGLIYTHSSGDSSLKIDWANGIVGESERQVLLKYKDSRGNYTSTMRVDDGEFSTNTTSAATLFVSDPTNENFQSQVKVSREGCGILLTDGTTISRQKYNIGTGTVSQYIQGSVENDIIQHKDYTLVSRTDSGGAKTLQLDSNGAKLSSPVVVLDCTSSPTREGLNRITMNGDGVSIDSHVVKIPTLASTTEAYDSIVIDSTGKLFKKEASTPPATKSKLEEMFIGHVVPRDLGDELDPSFVMADGRALTLSRYPDLKKKIDAGKLHIIDFDQTGVIRSANLGGYMWTDATKTEVYIPHLGGLFARYATNTTEVGKNHVDTMRNITGSTTEKTYSTALGSKYHDFEGAFSGEDTPPNSASWRTGATAYPLLKIKFSSADSLIKDKDGTILEEGTLGEKGYVSDETAPKHYYERPLIYVGEVII